MSEHLEGTWAETEARGWSHQEWLLSARVSFVNFEASLFTALIHVAKYDTSLVVSKLIKSDTSPSIPSPNMREHKLGSSAPDSAVAAIWYCRTPGFLMMAKCTYSLFRNQPRSSLYILLCEISQLLLFSILSITFALNFVSYNIY